MSKILTACLFAAEKHKTQRRKDKDATPYINHPIHVAWLLTDANVTDEDTIIAAILHDTIEDTKTSSDEITKLFGENVTKIVLECSDDKLLSKERRKQLQIEHASEISMSAKLVKLADKYSNASDLLNNPPKSWSQEEISGYAIWVYAVYQKLKGINKIFDEKFTALFNKFGIKGDKLEAKLHKYYKIIRNSE